MYKVIAIVGPTGVDKDKYVYEINEKFQLPILIVDSMKVYRLMNVGTSKPPSDYLNKYIHFGINIKNHWETFNVGEFFEYVKTIFGKFNYIIAVAGSPMYLKVILHGIFQENIDTTNVRKKLEEEAKNKGLESLYAKLKEMDLEYAKKISCNDKKRIIRALEIIEATGEKFSKFHTHFKNKPMYRTLTIGIREDKKKLKKLIEDRTKKMIQNGIIDEVINLKKIADFSPQAKEAIGYKDTLSFLENKHSLEELETSINRNTLLYIKHQNTWFKKMVNIWIEKNDNKANEINQHILNFLNLI